MTLIIPPSVTVIHLLLSYYMPVMGELNVMWFLHYWLSPNKRNRKNNNHWSLGPLNCQDLLVRRKFDWYNRTLVFHAETSCHLVCRAFDNHTCNTTWADCKYL